MTIPEKVLIVGAGQAGCQTAVSLREKGFAGRIALIGADDALPYRRPPLSKGFLGGHVAADLLWLRPEEFYREQDIELRTGTMAQRIDRRARRIQLSSGAWIDYDMLVLAIGSRHRPTAVQAGALDGVVALRTVTEAEVLRARLSSAKELVVVGGGFIGLEVASVAVEMGIGVTVLEAGNRLMGRAVTTPISGYCAEMHARRGVRIELGARPARILGEGGRAFAVETADGRRIPADVVLQAIGVVPNVELAAEAGLQVDNGILVDERLSTSDPTILAIGDCAAWPTRFAGGRVRLESVQNAVEQARFVASRIAGAHSAPYDAVPWFWSDQGREFKLQIAGITSRCDAVATRGVIEDGSFSAFCFREGRFIGAESVNRPVDHMNARRLLALGAPLRPEEAADEEFDFRIYAELATGRTSLPNKDRGW